jgi:hypothetical protein
MWTPDSESTGTGLLCSCFKLRPGLGVTSTGSHSGTRRADSEPQVGTASVMTAEDRAVSEPVTARVDLPGVDLPTCRLAGYSPTWQPEALFQLEVQQAALASAGPVPGGRAPQTVGGSDGRGTGKQIIGQAAPRPGALRRARPTPGRPVREGMQGTVLPHPARLGCQCHWQLASCGVL